MNGQQRKNIRPGVRVEIVLKQDQRSGRRTTGIVKEVLTSSAQHPHGIKVRLENGQIGRVKTILAGASQMSTTRIQTAVQQATDTRSVTIGSGAIAAVDEVFKQNFPDRSAVVIADDNTFAVAGSEVQRLLKTAGVDVREPFVFPGQPVLHADYAHVLELEEALRGHNAIPVVVGSGTLNDLTKLAAQRCERSYFCVATAASMDGYTAFGAAITRDGIKQTLACAAPRALLADVDILIDAPPALTASGYADLLGKITAGADWLIAATLDVEPIQPQAWSLVQDSLRDWTAQPQRLRQRDPQAIARLAEGLIFSGLAMQAAQSSRPASGSEHQFSHLWEMENLAHNGELISHGFKVGVGSIASAALYRRVLSRDLSQLDIEALCRQWPTREQVTQIVRQSHRNPIMAENAVQQSLVKYIEADQLRTRLLLLRERWAQLRDRLMTQLLTAEQLRGLLRAAGCPISPIEIGLDRERMQASYMRARQIRSRYTIFDLAAETGCFEACVGELFAPGGFWVDN